MCVHTYQESSPGRQNLGVGNELQPQDICGYLWNGGRGQGALGLVVDSMLETEEHCEDLVPWDRTDMTRDEWIANLKEIVSTWKRGNLLILGPDNEEEKEHHETPVNVSQLVTQLKVRGIHARPSCGY